MKRESIDIFTVEKHNHAVHSRLLNWADLVRVRGYPKTSPMFAALGVRTNSRQWDVPEVRDQINPIDAQAVDPALAALIVQFGIGYLVMLQQELA